MYTSENPQRTILVHYCSPAEYTAGGISNPRILSCLVFCLEKLATDFPKFRSEASFVFASDRSLKVSLANTKLASAQGIAGSNFDGNSPRRCFYVLSSFSPALENLGTSTVAIQDVGAT